MPLVDTLIYLVLALLAVGAIAIYLMFFDKPKQKYALAQKHEGDLTNPATLAGKSIDEINEGLEDTTTGLVNLAITIANETEPVEGRVPRVAVLGDFVCLDVPALMAGKEKHFNKVSEVSNQITIQAVKQRDEAVQSQKNSELLIERQAQEIKQLSTDYKTKVIDEAKTVRSVRGTMPTTGTGYPRKIGRAHV